MIYAYDENVLLPVKDIYDTQIMLASIQAAKDMYEKGQEQIKDFLKNYGDFYSPISKDMDWYLNNVTGPMSDTINWLYENGIDPIRSAQGRAIIARAKNNMPIGEINKRKMAAQAASEYLKNRGALEAKGLFNPDYERYTLGGKSIEDWDTEKDGMWLRTSPAEFKDLNEATSHWFDNLQPEFLGMDSTGMYRINGVSQGQLERSLTPQLPGFIGSNLGAYYYDKAKRALQDAGNPSPTQDEVINLLKSQIVTANKERMHNTYEADPYKLDDYRSANDIAAYAKKAATDYYYDMLKDGADTDGDGKISKEERKAYNSGNGNGNHNSDNVFWRAEHDFGNGGFATYLPEASVEERISPVHSGVAWNKKNNEYIMGTDVAKQVFYSHNSVYNSKYIPSRVPNLISREIADGEDVIFSPSGNLHARTFENKKTKKRKTRYWIAGNILKKDGTDTNGKPIYRAVKDANGNSTFEMEVKDNRARYARTKQKQAESTTD